MSDGLPGLEGKVAWVTGAGRGIGATYAAALARAGVTVACLDVNGDAAESVSAAIRGGGGHALAIEADVTRLDSMQRAADRAAVELGPADIVIPNAGVLGPIGPTVDADVDLWGRALAVNLTGVFLTVKVAVPQMQHRGGSIVLVASVSALRGWTGMIAYHATKHGVIGLMRSWANEFAADGIRVNAVCPGWVDTSMIDTQAEAAGLSRAQAEALWSKDQLIERFVKTSEVADAVLWLCSDAAAMINGVALPVDGGLLERTIPV